ncbi:MAG: hypothetical protein ACK5MA_10520 [Parachlamydiaceae bacterium]
MMTNSIRRLNSSEPPVARRHLHRRRKEEAPLVPSLEAFNKSYAESADKKGLMHRLREILKRSEKEWGAPECTALARTYILLHPEERKILRRSYFSDPLKCKIHKICGNVILFPPLLLLADHCTLEHSERKEGRLLFEDGTMPELYRTAYSCLRDDKEKSAFNARRIADDGKKIHDIFRLPIQIKRSGLEARMNVYTYHLKTISVAISSTHHYLPSDNETLETAPIVADCAFYQDEEFLFTSLTDSRERSAEAVKTAIQVNAHFMNCLHKLKKNRQLRPMDLLEQASFLTARLCNEEEIQESVAHCGLFARKNTDQSVELCVSLLGDTGAYLVVEWADGFLQLEKLCSSTFNEGSFSIQSDLKNLRFCQFTVPAPVNNVLIIQATAGLWDNIDPRNALKPEISLAMSKHMMNPSNFYQSANLLLESGDFSTGDIYTPESQNDPEVYEATHQFPNPHSMQLYLNPEAFLRADWVDWETTPLDEIIPNFEKRAIDAIYPSSAPDTFARNLVQYAKRQGKPDDIGVLVVNPTFINK